MSADSEILLPPNDPTEFESLCLDLWKEIWGPESGAQKNGRSGQTQAIFGRQNGRWIGIQCKQKDGLLRTVLNEKELSAEVEKAKIFEPRLSAFIIATSGPSDAKVQERAREIRESHENVGLFTVDVWSWQDIWRELFSRRDLLRRLWPIYWPQQHSLAGEIWSDLSGVDPRPFRSMARRPGGFVNRVEFAHIVVRLTEDSKPEESTVASTIALRGPGGFGQTSLAQAVCFDSRVQGRFPDGILWVKMGEDLRPSDRLGRIRDLLRWLKQDPPTFETLGAASAALREAIGDSRVLIVVDDAWVNADLAPFSELPSTATVLITTRD